MGAITEPCGTPLITGAQSEYIPSHAMRCFLSLKNFSTQVFTGPVIPYFSSFWISLWCGTLSNALAKSIIITSVCLPPLRLARISCVRASNCVSVYRFFRNPCCLSKRNLLASSWFSMCFEIMCSISLLHTHMSDSNFMDNIVLLS